MRVKNLIVKNKLKLINNSRLVNKKGYINGTAKIAKKDKYGNEIKKGLIPSVNTEFDKLKSANIRLNKFNNELKENISMFENSDRYMGEWRIGTMPVVENDKNISPAIGYSGGKFVIAFYATDRGAYSTDGINWTQTTLPMGDHRQICYINDKFVLVSDNKAAYSEDGINWNTNTNTNILSGYIWIDACYGDGKIVSVSLDNNKAAYTEDGINWVVATLPCAASWRGIYYGNGKFVAIASNSNNAAYSTDGINWTLTTLPCVSNWHRLCYSNGKFVAIAESSNNAAYSTDGINWILTTLPCVTEWCDICYGNGKFIACSHDKVISYSYDGINWELLKCPNERYYRICYGDGKFVLPCRWSSTVICIDSRKKYNDKYLV